MYYVKITDEFKVWFDEQSNETQDRIVAYLLLLKEVGPQLSRPFADTLNSKEFNNLKELRVQLHGDPYRIFYAFNPLRQAIILCAGNKKGNEKQFYQQMIPVAEKLYKKHLESLKKMVYNQDSTKYWKSIP